MKSYRIILICGILLLTIPGGEAFAQMNNKAPNEFRGLDRWSFKTNAVDWLMTVPNVNVEFDLSPSPFNRMTLGLTAKYNWEMQQSHLPYTNFNLLTIKPEFRYYWRVKEGPDFENLARREKGAYYVGAYVDGGVYSLKLSDIGHQGQHYGIGASFGFAMPLYNFRRGMLDIEFGLSVGTVLATSDAFTLNTDTNTYDVVHGECKELHVVPFPVVSEMSVSFAWRRTSIKHKYLKVDTVKQLERKEKKDARKNK